MQVISDTILDFGPRPPQNPALGHVPETDDTVYPEVGSWALQDQVPRFPFQHPEPEWSLRGIQPPEWRVGHSPGSVLMISHLPQLLIRHIIVNLYVAHHL